MENETIDKLTDKPQINNQETTFLLLETKGNRNYNFTKSFNLYTQMF